MFPCNLEWVILILCGHFLQGISTDDCLKKCGKDNGQYQSDSAPKFKWNFTSKDIVLKSRVEIECPLCQNNPSSTIKWLFNESPLDRKDIEKYYFWCDKRIIVQIRHERDVGNYTCVVKNRFGSGRATTQVVMAYDGTRPPIYFDKQSVRNQLDMRIGSQFNITCSQTFWGCRLKWYKNSKELGGTLDGRIRLFKERVTTGDEKESCSLKLSISDVRRNDTGKYRCTSNKFYTKTEPININAVICFQGYYCPPKAVLFPPQRCPVGKFSMYKNATTVDHCKPCPTDELGAIEEGLEEKTAELFRRNCGQANSTCVDSRKTSSLSTGVKIAIGVMVAVIFFASIVAVFCGFKICCPKYKHYFGIARDHEIEIPDIPRTNDVFICYSSKNKTWVCETLRRNLDAEKFQTKVDKDFEPGVDIHENVINAIYGSRKTIFVLSKDSLKSYKARTNLRQALIAGRTGHEVIVILYEKCKVPVEIRNKQIYLDWTDEDHREIFWDKLYRAIRRPLRDENQSAV